MIIRLSLAQERKLLEWSGRHTEAEVNADCLPSGYVLEISITGPFGEYAQARAGSRVLDLGPVEVELEMT